MLHSSQVLLHLIDDVRRASVILSDPVFIENGVVSAKLVRLVFAVESLQVVHDGWGHVRVLLASSHRRENHGATLLHQRPCEAPHWEDNHEEESEPESKTLLGGLNPHGVEVHVELWSEVTVKNRVDVFQVVASCVLVQRVGLRVRSVPASTSSTNCMGLGSSEDRRALLRTSHQRDHQRIAGSHF